MASIMQVQYLHNTYNKIFPVAVNRIVLVICIIKQRMDVNTSIDKEQIKNPPLPINIKSS